MHVHVWQRQVPIHLVIQCFLFFFFWCRRQMSTLIIFTDNPVTGNWLATYDKVKTRLSQIKRKWNRVCREENEHEVNRWERRLLHSDSGLFDQCRENSGGNSRQPSCLVLCLQITQIAVCEMIGYFSVEWVMLYSEKSRRCEWTKTTQVTGQLLDRCCLDQLYA